MLGTVGDGVQSYDETVPALKALTISEGEFTPRLMLLQSRTETAQYQPEHIAVGAAGEGPSVWVEEEGKGEFFKQEVGTQLPRQKTPLKEEKCGRDSTGGIFRGSSAAQPSGKGTAC